MIKEDGRVGIATTSPAYKLDINGGAVVRSSLTVTGDALLATTSGNVGIGITNPLAKLDVQGSSIHLGTAAATSSGLTIRAAGDATINTDYYYGYKQAELEIGGAGRSIQLSGPAPEINFPQGNLVLAVGSSQIFKLADSSNNMYMSYGDFAGANVGIGITNPTWKLHIGGGRASFLVGTSSFAVTQAGNVGIGTTAPGAKLQVDGGVMCSSISIGGVTQLVGYAPVIASTSPSHTMDISATDYVAIATVTATLKGGRPLRIDYRLDTLQTLASARTHTLAIYINGVKIDEHPDTTSGSGATGHISDFEYIASSTAGSNVVYIAVKSDNASGTQTGSYAKILLTEY
jgi:hypothetical protein